MNASFAFWILLLNPITWEYIPGSYSKKKFCNKRKRRERERDVTCTITSRSLFLQNLIITSLKFHTLSTDDSQPRPNWTFEMLFARIWAKIHRKSENLSHMTSRKMYVLLKENWIQLKKVHIEQNLNYNCGALHEYLRDSTIKVYKMTKEPNEAIQLVIKVYKSAKGEKHYLLHNLQVSLFCKTNFYPRSLRFQNLSLNGSRNPPTKCSEHCRLNWDEINFNWIWILWKSINRILLDNQK